MDGAFGSRVRALAAWRAAAAARGPQTDWQLAATLAAALADCLGMPGDEQVFPLMAVDAYLRANAHSPAAGRSSSTTHWKQAARREALRE